MRLPFPIIIALLLSLGASIGSAVGSKDKGKRKLDDTSFELSSSSASQHLQHSGGPQQQSHHENEQGQHESTSHRVPYPFGLVYFLKIFLGLIYFYCRFKCYTCR
jgi:hypothetical protein